MSQISRLFNDFTGWARGATLTSPATTPAAQLMQRLNPRALMSVEAGDLVFIEDHSDSEEDGRIYRLEYRSTPNGRRAVAFCLHNPWSQEGQDPQADEMVHIAHIFSDGLLCLGTGHCRNPRDSRRSLEWVVARARYWCTGFSVLKETGSFPET